MKNIIGLLLAFVLVTNTYAQKKALTHDVYDSWNSIRSSNISNDGQWITYAITPLDGNITTAIYNTKNKDKTLIPRGSSPQLSYDNQFIILKIKPDRDSVKMMRRNKVKKKDLPKDSLAIYQLSNGNMVRIPNIVSHQMPQKAGQWLAYQVENKTKKKPKKEEKTKDTKEKTSEKKAKPKKKKAKKESKKNGYKLIVRNLGTTKEDTFHYVTSYQFTENGKRLAFITTGKDSTFEAGVYILELGTGSLRDVFSQKGDYKKLTWDKAGNQLAFIADVDTSKGHDDAFLKYYNVYHWQAGDDKASMIANAENSAFLPNNWYINKNSFLNFAENGSKLYFGTAPKPIQPDTTLLPEEKVKLDVWHWQDDFLQPQQLSNLNRNKNRTYTAVYHINDGKTYQIGTEEIPSIRLVNKGDSDIAIGIATAPYGKYISWEGFPYYNDAYVFDLKTGEKEQLLTKSHGSISVSPKGKYLYWYTPSDSTWIVYDIATKKEYWLTKDTKNSFFNEENDTPNHPRSYGVAGWTENDESILINDRFDIWEFDPQNRKAAVRITKNGRETKTSYRYVRFDFEHPEIKRQEPMFLKGFDETSKAEGYYQLSLKKGAPKQLLKDDFRFSYPQKAKNSDELFFTKGNFQNFPDIYCSNLKLKKVTKVSMANPQQRDYLWGTVEPTSWTDLDGDKLDGLIYKPENFDPNKKYPMMVYFYESYSDRLHSHYAPAPIRSIINFTYFTSNGYVVFVPNIKYQDGFPGQSAYNSLMPGVLAMIEKGYVDKERIGIQGHSWGGYQIAYLVTKTNLFKCAEAGAPVSNMTSAYGGIRWTSGLSRMFQYEHTQSRIGGTLWEKPSHYIENSPVFRADKVETPLLMMHNDKDGAVPWYQGIEYFVALRRLGKPVWMLNYNGEAHGLQKMQNKKDFTIRMYQFFDHYLKDAPAPEWLESGIPAVEKGANMGLGN